MHFEWDEEKRLVNLEQHGVDFRKIIRIFENHVSEQEDARNDYGETRLRALGSFDGRYYVVVYTWRDDVRRIISAWRVDDEGRRRYQALLAGRIEGDV